MLSSSNITMSPIFMFSRCFVHLFHNFSNGKYSFIQWFQYILVTACTDFHFVRLLTFFSVMFAKFVFGDDRQNLPMINRICRSLQNTNFASITEKNVNSRTKWKLENDLVLLVPNHPCRHLQTLKVYCSLCFQFLIIACVMRLHVTIDL